MCSLSAALGSPLQPAQLHELGDFAMMLERDIDDRPRDTGS